jgi:hypothetical protein
MRKLLILVVLLGLVVIPAQSVYVYPDYDIVVRKCTFCGVVIKEAVERDIFGYAISSNVSLVFFDPNEIYCELSYNVSIPVCKRCYQKYGDEYNLLIANAVKKFKTQKIEENKERYKQNWVKQQKGKILEIDEEIKSLSEKKKEISNETID